MEEDNLLINAAVLPDKVFISELQGLKTGEGLYDGDTFLAARLSKAAVEKLAQAGQLPTIDRKNINSAPTLVDRIWKIFSLTGQEISKDFILLTAGRKSAPISEGTFVRNPSQIFIEEGAVIENASLNATDGPIYIGKDAEVMEGCMIRGPFSLGEHSVIKMGAKIYGPTTIGPHCKVGGEVTNGVFFGYSNKAHDGFVGNAVIGEWCNLGADTNNSNLKNNYEEVKVWSHIRNGFERTGLQFCGLFMGDHSKCGINTMFNTGTVIGVSANIFGGGFPRTFIPSFSWGGASGFTVYQINKALETAEKVLARRSLPLTTEDTEIFNHIFEQTKAQRNF
jgi:UDP-N-acetylglucosamine diphosphorylase/glucosamine-1-phosphate N-acetyltransferase